MMQPPVDIKKTEDGGVEIDFDPQAKLLVKMDKTTMQT